MAWMWIVAGPNGAGKTSFTIQLLKKLLNPDLVRLNADDVTLALRAADTDTEQEVLNLHAAQIIDARVAEFIESKRDFLVETVLSSDKYRDDLQRAKENGFRVGLVYISLYPPELSPSRVQERVRKGGHHVDWNKAIDRWHRSHQELGWFAPRADILFVYDNSEENGEPVLIGYYNKQENPFLFVSHLAHQEIATKLYAAFAGSVPITSVHPDEL